MTALTVRLDPETAKQFDQFCKKYGYSKNGVIKSLICNFLHEESESEKILQKNKMKMGKLNLNDLVGIVSLGGDAVEDSETAWWES